VRTVPEETTGEGGAGGQGGSLRVDERSVREDGRFVVEPRARGGEGTARSIRAVRFGRQDGYERLVVEFGSGEGAASRVPAWFLTSPEGDSSLRVEFPGVSRTAVAQGELPGELMEGFYVSRRPDGMGYLVEILSDEAFRYRVSELRDPARLIIDYRREDSGYVLPAPATSERIVLLQPREGVIVGRDLLVNGYSRNESQRIILRGPGGQVLARANAPTRDEPEPWAYFERTLRIPPFEGRATLSVGGEGGVEVSIIYGGSSGGGTGQDGDEPRGRTGGGSQAASGG
jgi:hypothetical protein